MIALGSQWNLILTGLLSLAGAAFFIYIGFTGANFYWVPESAEDEEVVNQD